jgi:hypothetical protein
MPDPIDRFRNVMRNRVETAKRWHGLKKLDDIYDFAMQDPAVAALWAHERFQKQVILEATRFILDHADEEPVVSLLVALEEPARGKVSRHSSTAGRISITLNSMA